MAIKRGDIIKLGENAIMCGDAANPRDVEALFGDRMAGIVVTSPPYLHQRDYKDPIVNWTDMVANAINQIPCRPDVQAIVNLGLIYRKKQWYPYWNPLFKKLKNHGWNAHGWYVWYKANGMPTDPSKGRLWSSFEFLFHWNKGVSVAPRKIWGCKNAGNYKTTAGQRTRNGTTRDRKHLITNEMKPMDDVVIVPAYGQSHGHPAPFPSGVPEQMLKTWPLKYAYDPFVGSGTTLLAAQKIGIKCLAMEIAPEYVELVVRRFKAEFPLFM